MEIKEIITKTYFAFDGTEFEDEYSCKNYETKKQQKQLEEETMKKLKIDATIPIPFFDNENITTSAFLIKCEDDLQMFINSYQNWFGNGNKLEETEEIKNMQFPAILCIVDHVLDEHYQLYNLQQFIEKLKSYVETWYAGAGLLYFK